MLSWTDLQETDGETQPDWCWINNELALQSQPSESPDRTITGGAIGRSEKPDHLDRLMGATSP